MELDPQIWKTTCVCSTVKSKVTCSLEHRYCCTNANKNTPCKREPMKTIEATNDSIYILKILKMQLNNID